VREGFAYERRSEPGTRPPALTLKLGRGSCRDLALLMIEALRSLGLAARFVTGYLYLRGSERVGSSSCCQAA
jgi:transglutaminase-like putative cysteine protease